MLGVMVSQLSSIAKDIGSIRTGQAHLGAQMARLEAKVDCTMRKMTPSPSSTRCSSDVLKRVLAAIPWLKPMGIGLLLALGSVGYLQPEEVRATILWMIGRW